MSRRTGPWRSGLHPESNPSQSALISRGALQTVLSISLASESCSVLCLLDILKIRLSAFYPDEIDTSSNVWKDGILVLLDEEDIKGEEEGDRSSDDDFLEDAAGADTFTKRAARPDAPTSSPRAFR